MLTRAFVYSTDLAYLYLFVNDSFYHSNHSPIHAFAIDLLIVPQPNRATVSFSCLLSGPFLFSALSRFSEAYCPLFLVSHLAVSPLFAVYLCLLYYLEPRIIDKHGYSIGICSAARNRVLPISCV